MNQPLLIVSLMICMLSIRLGGLALAGVPIPLTWERYLRYIPVALLAGLTVNGVAGRPEDVWQGAVAAACAALAGWHTRKLWTGILAGMSAYWLLHLPEIIDLLR